MSNPRVSAAPPADSPAAPRFHDLYRPEALQAANPHVFPSVASLLWFARMNRAELLKAGAIVEIAGRNLLCGSKFIEVAMQIGARRAGASA
jgi:hypothetical protein